MAVVLDRPRHEDGIKAIREAGGRVQLITDGDVSGALNAVSPDRTADFLWGIGGTPEGVISAAAVKCIGGALVGRLWPRDDDERQAAVDAGYDPAQVLTHDDLVRGQDVFFSATGVTDGDVLQGVRYEGSRGATHRVARDAVALGHRAADPVAPRPRQADRASPVTPPTERHAEAEREARGERADHGPRRVADRDAGAALAGPRRCPSPARRRVPAWRSGRPPTPRARAAPASAGTRA